MFRATNFFLSTFLSISLFLFPLSAVQVQAQSTVPYRFFVWSDGNGNNVFDGSGRDICWRSGRALTVYGNGGMPIEPLLFFNLYNLSTYNPGSQSAVNQCMAVSSPTKWLIPNYPYGAIDNYTGSLTTFTTVSGGSTTTYVGIQVYW